MKTCQQQPFYSFYSCALWILYFSHSPCTEKQADTTKQQNKPTSIVQQLSCDTSSNVSPGRHGQTKVKQHLVWLKWNYDAVALKMSTYLFVHENIDDWIVDGSCLGEEGWDRSQSWIQFNSWMCCDQYGEDCVWCPTHHECHDHHHHHAGHLALWFPGSGQTTVWYLTAT